MPHRPGAAGLLACLTAATIAAGGPAAALSCLPPDPVSAFAEANAADEIYVAVLGTFTGGLPPRAGGTMDGQPRSYIASFQGHSLNRDGPFEAIDRDVIVEESCAGPWCGQMEMGREVLTFLRVEPSGPPVATVGPCYGNVFFDPTEEQREAVRTCFVNGCTEM